jgi:hypothetical protein
MIDDAVRLAGRTAVRLARAIPLVGSRFGAPPHLDLDGRVVFVTGAARGLGAQISRQAHARGARVALVGRRLGPLTTAVMDDVLMHNRRVNDAIGSAEAAAAQPDP